MQTRFCLESQVAKRNERCIGTTQRKVNCSEAAICPGSTLTMYSFSKRSFLVLLDNGNESGMGKHEYFHHRLLKKITQLHFHYKLQDGYIVMALGGNPDLKSNVELLDVSLQGGICTKPADFPDGKDLGLGAVGAFIDGMPTVCGGREGGRECHGYKFEIQAWLKLPFLMIVEREEAAGSTMKNGSWIVTGGRSKIGEALANSEVLINQAFHTGPLWPLHFWGHCSLSINETHGFIAGGRNERKFVRTSFELEYESGFWTWIADINFDRSGHVCGKLESMNEKLIVVAGGRYLLEVEILSLSTRKWINGPVLPHEMDQASSLQNNDDFIIIGGLHLGDCPIKLTECFSSKYIYRLDNFTEWKRIQTSMDVSRGQHVAIAIPRVNVGAACSKLCPTCPGILKHHKKI